MADKSRTVFIREATGLVRDFSWFDAFAITAGAIGFNIFASSSQIAFVAAVAPGADIAQTVNLALIFLIPLCLAYSMVGIVMPRSGGDYVWISRTIDPGLGFIMGWAFWVVLLTFVGTEAYLFSALILPVTFAAFGFVLNSSALLGLASYVTTPVPVIVIGILVLILVCALNGMGAKLYGKVTLVMFAVLTISTLVAFWVFSTHTHADFVNGWNSFGTVTYDQVIGGAQKAGWAYTPATLGATLLGTPLGVLLIGYGYAGASSFSGEIRKVKSSLPIAILGSLLLCWFMAVVGIYLSIGVIGNDFIQASTFLSGAGQWTIIAPPWTTLLIAALTHDPIVLALVQIGWILCLPWSMTNWVLVSTRYVFSFSFDRVLPVKFADVSERFHFPIKAMILNFVVGIIFFFLAAFTPYLSIWINSTAIVCIVWVFGSIAIILLPYRKPDLVESLPGSKMKVPLISILGVISLLTMVAMIYFSFAIPGIGPSTPQADAIMAGIFLSGLVVYVASYYYRKREGIDLKLACSEIPPE